VNVLAIFKLELKCLPYLNALAYSQQVVNYGPKKFKKVEPISEVRETINNIKLIDLSKGLHYKTLNTIT